MNEPTAEVAVTIRALQWEYKPVIIMGNDPVKALNDMGADGWELCGFIPQEVPVQRQGGILQPGQQQLAPGLLCILKRVKREETDGEQLAEQPGSFLAE